MHTSWTQDYVSTRIMLCLIHLIMNEGWIGIACVQSPSDSKTAPSKDFSLKLNLIFVLHIFRRTQDECCYLTIEWWNNRIYAIKKEQFEISKIELWDIIGRLTYPMSAPPQTMEHTAPGIWLASKTAAMILTKMNKQTTCMSAAPKEIQINHTYACY